MTLKRFKTCRHCGKQTPRGWTESDDYACISCVQRIASQLDAERRGYRTQTALRSDPTRRSLRNQGDDLDPTNPLSLTSPLNPAHSHNWDDSSHRHHSSHDDGRHSSHSWGGGSDSSDSSSSDSGSSGGSSD